MIFNNHLHCNVCINLSFCEQSKFDNTMFYILYILYFSRIHYPYIFMIFLLMRKTIYLKYILHFYFYLIFIYFHTSFYEPLNIL